MFDIAAHHVKVVNGGKIRCDMWLSLVPRKKNGHENEITACAGPKLKKSTQYVHYLRSKIRTRILSVCPKYVGTGTRN